MRKNVPILTITLHIPLTPDTEVEEVLEAIASTVTEALGDIREQQAAEMPEDTEDDEASPQLSDEALESYTDTTQEDLLARLGYEGD